MNKSAIFVEWCDVSPKPVTIESAALNSSAGRTESDITKSSVIFIFSPTRLSSASYAAAESSPVKVKPSITDGTILYK